MKKIIAIILGASMIFAFTLVARGAEVECAHLDTTTTTVFEQKADCYHTYSKTIMTVCNDCGYTSLSVTKDSSYQHGPTITVDKSTPATCTEQGWIVVSKVCSWCGQEIEGFIQPVAPLEHKGMGCCVKYESTCTKAGYYESIVRCTECGILISHTKEELPLADHDWSEWERTDDGYERLCIECGETEVREECTNTIDISTRLFETIKNFFNKFIGLFSACTVK